MARIGNLRVNLSVWPYRLTVRTAPFHGVNRGSIPRGVTVTKMSFVYRTRPFFLSERMGWLSELLYYKEEVRKSSRELAEIVGIMPAK